MTFLPAVPLGGYAGWIAFQRSETRQFEIFENDQTTTRNVEYFKENIRTALTAGDLVNDRRLLTVALGAFGLSDEIDKKALIRRVLEDGTDNSDSFANRLNDPRWREFSESFGYGNLAGSRVLLSAFREEVAQKYTSRAFEARVGEVDTDVRLAMNFRREAAKIAQGESVDRVGWFQIMGQSPLRAVMETAFGLPASLAATDLDQQRSLFERKADQFLGNASPSIFSDPDIVDKVIRRFFLQREIQQGPSASTPGMAALSMLTNRASTSVQTINLLLANAR